MPVIRCIDLETTGFKRSEGHAVVEAAAWDIARDETGSLQCRRALSTLVNPCRHIPAGVSAIHHITDRDVLGAPLWCAVASMLEDGAEPIAWCAHFARFEQQWFDGAGIPWIDTYKVLLAKRPDLETHSNQGARYALGYDLDPALAMPPHRAAPDAYVTARHLIYLVGAGVTVREMINISARPALLVRVTFGKHAGELWSAVPTGYLRWIVDESNFPDEDPDIYYTAQTQLALRQKDQPKKEEF